MRSWICCGFLMIPLWAGQAAEVVGWRADGTGRFPASEAVTDWGETARVVWRTETPNWSNASPVVTGDRIFICAEPDILLCLDRGTGRILWQRSNTFLDLAPETEHPRIEEGMRQADLLQREVRGLDRQVRQFRRQLRDDAENETARTRLAEVLAEQAVLEEKLAPFEAYRMPVSHNANGYSSPTPVTDGSRVYVFFGTGVAAAYSMDGERIWARMVEKPTDNWGHSASPVLAGGRFVIHVRDVHGLDADTGETVWTVPSRARWGASVATEIDGRPVVITAHGDIIRAEDGNVLAAGLHRLDYNAPLVHEGVVYFIEHGGKAFRLPSVSDGSQAPELLWTTEPPRERYYASPLFHEGRIYCINQRGVYSVIDAETGEVLLSESIEALRRTVYPSVTLAGSLIFLGSEGGHAVFVEPGDTLRVAAETSVGSFRTSPVFRDGRAYVRTLDAMMCIDP